MSQYVKASTRRPHRSFLVAVLLLSLRALGDDQQGSGAAAGKPLPSVPVNDCKTTKPIVYSKLLSDYGSKTSADWAHLQTTLRAVIDATTCTVDGKQQLLNSPNASFIVAFPDASPSAPVLRRVVVYSGPTSVRSTRLSGTHLYDIHLFPADGKTNVSGITKPEHITSSYAFTPVANPLIGAISKAVGIVVGAYSKATLLGGSRGTESVSSAETIPVMSVQELDIADLQRATISVQDSAPAAIKGTVLSSTYFLGPLTTVEIGLGGAFVARTSLNQPAKVDSSKNLVDDSPTGLATYVALNWRPWGFDESSATPSSREAIRIVVGPILTPNPGVLLGVGFAPLHDVRAVSIQVSYGVMLANVLRGGDRLGQPPVDSAHPTRRGALGALLLGIGYGLQ